MHPQQEQGYWPPAETKRKRSVLRTSFKFIAYSAGLFIAFGSGTLFGAGGQAASNALPPAPIVAETPQVATKVETQVETVGEKAKPTPTKAGIYDEGILLVPGEVKPGRYRAVVPSDSYGCYYARLKNLDGGIDSIYDNGNGDPGQKMTVTIKKTDKAFETSGCGNWIKF